MRATVTPTGAAPAVAKSVLAAAAVCAGLLALLTARKEKQKRGEAEAEKERITAEHESKIAELREELQKLKEEKESLSAENSKLKESSGSGLNKPQDPPTQPGPSSSGTSHSPDRPRSPESSFWTMEGWLKQLEIHSVVRKSLADKVPSLGVEANLQETLELPLVKKLADDVGEEGLAELLKTNGCVDELAKLLHSEMVKLKEWQVRRSEGNDKFVVPLVYGHVRSFFHGLEGVVGPPSVSLNDAVELEHCSSADSHEEFEASNYLTKTTSCIEYHFVVHGEKGLELIAKDYPRSGKVLRTDGKGHMYPVENPTKLGENERRVPIRYQDMEDKLNERNEQLHQEGFAPVGKEEFISARLYTGPMYVKYNIVLRGLNDETDSGMRKEFHKLCGNGNNKYTTTLHLINSAVVKLGKLTEVGTVYRGLHSKSLPETFTKNDPHGVRGGVEFAFMSTTKKREVALSYANPDKVQPMVFQIQMGMVDRGADLSWMSQYPHEKEVLFAPLTGIDVQSLSVKDDVLVVNIRLSINQMHHPIEQVTAKMQHSHLELLKLLLDDLKFAGAPEKAYSKLASLYDEQQKAEPGWFNSAQNFADATQRALDVQQEVLITLCRPGSWELNESGDFIGEMSSEDRWKKTTEMRSVAAIVSRLGERGALPAIDLLRLSLDPRHLGTASENERDLCQCVREKMDPAISTAIEKAKQSAGAAFQMELSESDSGKAKEILRVAYFILKERVVQPWPPVLVKLLSDSREGGPKEEELLETKRDISKLSKFLQPIFIELLKGSFGELSATPFTTNASVLFWRKEEEKWDNGRIHSINPTKIVYKEQVIDDLKEQHVLSHTTSGVGLLLLEAARQGEARLVKLLLGAKVSPFFSDRDANTALILAAKAQKAAVCKVLVQGGANLNAFNKFRVNAFDMAVMQKDVETLQALKPSASSNISDMTKLMYVIYSNRVGGLEMVRPLIEVGVDVCEKTEKFASAIIVAAETGNVEIIRFLLAQNKSLVDYEGYDEGRTPLLMAAQNGRTDAVQCLLEHDADPTKMRKKMCAMHVAAQYGHAEVLKVLLETSKVVVGVDADLPHSPDGKRNGSGGAVIYYLSPLMLAARYGHVEATKVLLEAGAEVNKGDTTGWNSLHRAASAGHIKVIELLLSHDADMTKKNTSGLTPLAAAAKSGQANAVQLLMAKGANMGDINDDGQTPLLIACSNGHEAVVRTLSPSAGESPPYVRAERTNSLGVKDYNMRTPLIAAAEAGSLGSVRHLVSLKQWAKVGGGAPSDDDDEEIVGALKEARTGGHVAVASLLLRKLSSRKRQSRSNTLSIYACHQQTYYAQQRRELWLETVPISSLRLSMPPFNKAPPGVQLPENSEHYEIPVYGLRISSAIIDSFKLDGVGALAEELGVSFPKYELSKFVQGKMFKVRTLIEEARKREDCQSGVNTKAINKLERFVNDFVALEAGDIDGPDAWQSWVSERSVHDWMEKQEFSDLLSNFGFSAETGKQIRETEIDYKNDDGSTGKVTLGQYSMRWLSKAFAGYNFVGCLTDVANLLFAMKGPPPVTTPTEGEVVAVVKEVVEKLRAKDLTDIWIPTHMIHDAETDDMLAWLLLVHVHRLKGASSSLQVLVQLPTANPDYPQLETVAERLKARGCEIYRDPSARNAKAVKLAFDASMMQPPPMAMPSVSRTPSGRSRSGSASGR